MMEAMIPSTALLMLGAVWAALRRRPAPAPEPQPRDGVVVAVDVRSPAGAGEVLARVRHDAQRLGGECREPLDHLLLAFYEHPGGVGPALKLATELRNLGPVVAVAVVEGSATVLPDGVKGPAGERAMRAALTAPGGALLADPGVEGRTARRLATVSWEPPGGTHIPGGPLVEIVWVGQGGPLERRSHPRMDFQAPVRMRRTSGLYSGMARDISAGGMRLFCAEAPVVGEVLELDLPEGLSVQGRVVSVRSEGPVHDVRMRLAELPREQRNRLLRGLVPVRAGEGVKEVSR